jgi:hypothetical protein
MHWLLDVEFKDDLSRTAAATEPRTWLSCVALLLTSSAQTNEASRPEENQQLEPKLPP